MVRGTESKQIIEILLVEDSPGDARLTREVFADIDTPNRISWTVDVKEALQLLRRQGAFTEADRPDLILLDLNLPGFSGLEFLAEIKRDSELKSIPVLVLSTSSDVDDVRRSYELHANCYLQKPVDLDEFIDLARSVEAMWFQHVLLPDTG